MDNDWIFTQRVTSSLRFYFFILLLTDVRLELEHGAYMWWKETETNKKKKRDSRAEISCFWFFSNNFLQYSIFSGFDINQKDLFNEYKFVARTVNTYQGTDCAQHRVFFLHVMLRHITGPRQPLQHDEFPTLYCTNIRTHAIIDFSCIQAVYTLWFKMSLGTQPITLQLTETSLFFLVPPPPYW